MPSFTATVTVTDKGGHTGTTSATTKTWAQSGLPAGWTPASTVTAASTTLSTAGATYTDVDFLGRVSVTAPDVTLIRCRVGNANTANAAFTATNANALRCLVQDSLIRPTVIRNDTNGIVGHDVTLLRTEVRDFVDFIQVQNSSAYAAQGAGWLTGVVIDQSWLHGLARWTATAPGVVHTTDTVTHSDGVQQFGGAGTRITDSIIDARPSLGFGHMFVQTPGGVLLTAAQAYALPDSGPWIPAANGSLPDGGPFAAPADSSHAARSRPWESNGTGLRSQGELNSTDFSCIMMNSSMGASTDWVVTGNLFYGGQVPINGDGGNPYVAGKSLGTISGNVFAGDEGTRGHTIDLDSGWNGHATITGNTYLATGAAVTVRWM